MTVLLYECAGWALRVDSQENTASCLVIATTFPLAYVRLRRRLPPRLVFSIILNVEYSRYPLFLTSASDRIFV